MKKGILAVVIVLFVLGCGADKTNKHFEGTKISHDYAAEGITYLKKAEVTKAIYSFDKAIKQDPTNVKNYLLLGAVYMRFKNYQKAVDIFSAAIKIAPTNGMAYYMLGENKMLMGNKQEAIISIKKSAMIFEKQREAEKFKKAIILLRRLTEEQVPANVQK